ncbi:TPA: CoB--CoM heterodisulfide reductase subunit B, partial [Candidatus Bathyarchaeota archaeon]|nr:CoB--CoM heterodisulfide reductase subunit B [Candidatus Bathyarchaeota archaeon]
MEASKSRKYMFFLGCLIPYRVMSYEVSARKIARKIGIELVEMPEFYCCGLPVDQVSHELTILLSAQSLCMAEKAGLPIMTLCPGCYGTLNKVNQMLQEDRSLREEVNDHLREFGLKFEGNTKVRHLIQVLAEDVGLEMLTDFISNPLDNVVVAEHYGCHVLRPTKFSKFDNPEDPKILKSLIELTGAKCVNYVDEKECCGFPVAGIDENIVLNLVRDKLSHVKEARAEALITICPSCFLAYDVNQSRIKRMTGEEYSIPVLHYTELLSLAMGIDPKDLLLN